MTTPVEPERRAEAVKASLIARASELGRRINVARQTLDVRAYIASHPWAAVGIAIGLGASLGMLGTRRAGRGLGGTIATALGGLVISAIKDLALHQLSGWVDSGAREREIDNFEPFLEH